MSLREEVARLEHEQWSHWINYMFSNLSPENIQRWIHQASQKYEALFEKEKESDREWADRVLALIDEHNQDKCYVCKHPTERETW